ncbi:MAG: exosortase/archaeosortase family protein [Candidatus Diapherotrites archaeon]|nr:exosortase/archaeosortase family protein [Candidatus Diapherotrites archaeon]
MVSNSPRTKKASIKLFNKQELLKGARFLVLLSVFGLTCYFIVSQFMHEFEWVTAVLTSWVLILFGVSTTAFCTNPPTLTGVFALPVEILPLCVGDLELAILIGAILATEDRSWRNRFVGAIAGFLFVLLINPIRIALTLASGVWFGAPVMVFLHSLFFRLTLLVVLVGFYWFWYVGVSSIHEKLVERGLLGR